MRPVCVNLRRKTVTRSNNNESLSQEKTILCFLCFSFCCQNELCSCFYCKPLIVFSHFLGYSYELTHPHSKTKCVLFQFETAFSYFWRTFIQRSSLIVLCGQICKIIVYNSDPADSHYACEDLLQFSAR